MPELIAENVGYRYGRVEALSGVSLTLRPGRVHALLGPSGSGKSTLLALMAGLLHPSSGGVYLCENGRREPVTRPPSHLGMAFQPPGLWDHLTVERHLKLVLGRRDDERTHHVLALVGLVGMQLRRPGELSSGQRQRLSIARAIVHRPRWLLLDEPLAHLDGESRASLVETLRGVFVETGAAVLYATHQQDEVERLADECTLLRSRAA